MDNGLIENIVMQSPNFLGFTLALLIMVRITTKQHELIIALIERWENCERDRERREQP